MPSVIKTTIFLELEFLVGKSRAPDSNAFAIGVVPLGLSVFNLCLIAGIVFVPKLTSSFVSLQPLNDGTGN